MKIIFTLLLQIIAYAGSVVSSIWAIVEFILYLVKDKAFNWWSVWMILICIGAGIVLFFFNLFFMIKQRSKESKTENRFGKSRFQQRLEEMAEKRKQNL
jgi:phosphotransferase system  glucose/maltose/N-acetylglucosamine-specific IIC component